MPYRPVEDAPVLRVSVADVATRGAASDGMRRRMVVLVELRVKLGCGMGNKWNCRAQLGARRQHVPRRGVHSQFWLRWRLGNL